MIKDKILGLSSKLIYRFKARSPQIWLGIGLVGVTWAAVEACKATLKAVPVLEENNKTIEHIKENDPDDKKALARAYFDTTFDVVRLYTGPVVIGVISLWCIVKGHKVLIDRNTHLIGAYKLLEGGYNRYRQRVIDEYGEETDRLFYHNLRKGDVEVEKDGKKKKLKNVDILDDDVNPLEVSYDRVFDESNWNWTGHPDEDIFFLKQREEWCTQMVQSRGHIFLNEVYDVLGFQPSEAGQFVGWVKGNGDGYVDFGIKDIEQELNRKFINGDSQYVLLTFNVDGYIADKI